MLKVRRVVLKGRFFSQSGSPLKELSENLFVRRYLYVDLIGQFYVTLPLQISS